MKLTKEQRERIIDEWARKNRWHYDCYKDQIQELKDKLNTMEKLKQ